jgi:signal transduction histidine kinase
VGTFNRAAHIITGIEKQDAYQKNVNDLFKTTLLPEPIDENALEAIKEGFDTQFTMTKSDNETSVISSSTTIMESEEKEKLGIKIKLNDITQITRLEEEAERKNRLTAMGEIAMQVAHEIRNPLGSIELFISMMRMDLIEDADQLDLINHISSATRSMNHIISNLLEFTKPKPITLDTVDIHQLLTEFCEFSKFSAEQLRIAIDLDLAAESNEIMGNGELMKQVFHNIFVNACQAMPEGGHLSISTRDVVETDSVILDRFNNSSMRHNGSLKLVNITFKDTGKGMPEDTKRKVFDPFFTTREQGTGLGMSIAHNSIASHGGIILIDSVENHGTEIALLLPIANP